VPGGHVAAESRATLRGVIALADARMHEEAEKLARSEAAAERDRLLAELHDTWPGAWSACGHTSTTRSSTNCSNRSSPTCRSPTATTWP
jgi:hypothetical protein